MFIPKFDIYKTEWLDLVFKDRNQSYGAYELRKHYARTLLRSMGVTALIILALFLVAISRSESSPVSPVPSTQTSVSVDLRKEITSEQTHPLLTTTRHRHSGGTPTIIPVGPEGNTSVTNNPLSNNTAAAAPGVIETKPTHIPATAPTIAPTTSAQTQITDFPDVMPEPNGGISALTSFLKQNLQYPEAAANSNISGSVILSFVVETDGHLTDIRVTRSAGFGFDEEAIRVLKLAPAWQPGTQNGHAVRVRYSIPVNFRIVK